MQSEHLVALARLLAVAYLRHVAPVSHEDRSPHKPLDVSADQSVHVSETSTEGANDAA